MAADAKSKSLMGPAKRFELWLVYSLAYAFLALCVFWNLGRHTDEPLTRLLFTGQLVFASAVIAVLVRHFYEKDGKRVRKTGEAPAPAVDTSAS